MIVAFGTFTVAAVLIVLLPGPDTLVVVRGMVRGGRRGGVLTAAGVLCGLCCWVIAASMGLAALLRASEVGYDILKFAGAAYLIWMGVQSFSSLRKTDAAAVWSDGSAAQAAQAAHVGTAHTPGVPAATASTADSAAPAPTATVKGRSGFLGGLLTDLLNPKVGVFFISFLPGFVPDGWSVGLTTASFGAWFVALTGLYFVGLVAVSGTIADWMQTPRIRKRLDAVTGLVLVGFGVRLATES